MKKFILFGLMLAFALSVVGCSGKSISFDIENATILQIAYGDTNEIIEITDNDTIKNITDNINSLSFENKSKANGMVGYAYKLTWMDKNKNEIECVLITETNGYQICSKGYYYNVSADLAIDVNLIDNAISTFQKSNDNNFKYPIKVEENCVAVIGKGTLSQAVELSVEDTDFLLKTIENIEWVENNPKCIQDCAITLKGNLYYYHSSCGTLERIDLSEVSTHSSKEPKNSGMFILDNETKDLVNTILEKYIELEK